VTARRGTRGAIAVLAAIGGGGVVVGVGLGLVPHVVKVGLSLPSVLAVAAVLVGLGAVVAGAMVLARPHGLVVRVVAAVGALGWTVLAAMVVAPAVAVNHVPRTQVGATPAEVGLTYEAVELEAADGVRLAAWYLPADGRPGEAEAAVVVRHGAGSTRSNVLAEAAVLVRAGFDVVMVDARGHGDSAGRAMDFGWDGEVDVAAAVGHLVDERGFAPGTVGVLGSSMGGEEALGAAGIDLRIGAVVAEGATARVAADKAWLSDAYGWRGAAQEQIERLQYGLTALLAEAPRPGSLRGSVAAADAPVLLITAGDVADEARAAAFIAEGAPERVAVWTVPGAGHTDGLAVDPDGWARRVVGFFRRHLVPR
jgi:pimeloyl-ACP methyl ester carboxylesterase